MSSFWGSLKGPFTSGQPAGGPPQRSPAAARRTADDLLRNLGDVGMLYFWFRRQDLQTRAFERTWMVLQCC